MRNATDITVVLDRSGSMNIIAADTIGGFNKFLEDQKAVPFPANFTLVQFNHNYEFVCKGVPIRDAKPLDSCTFVPHGNTALLDAIGRAINETGKRLADMNESDRPDKVVFCILTDGEENSSKEFTYAQIEAMIKRQTDEYQWQFLFLGANQDAIKNAAGLGIGAGTTMCFAGSEAGVRDIYKKTSGKLASYRSTSKVGDLQFTSKDRDDQKALGASH